MFQGDDAYLGSYIGEEASLLYEESIFYSECDHNNHGELTLLDTDRTNQGQCGLVELNVCGHGTSAFRDLHHVGYVDSLGKEIFLIMI